MAKELPYFQFEPAQYLTGNIQFCSLNAQGLFINICCIYWQRECDLTLEQLHKKFPANSALNELINEAILKINKDERIYIDFLTNQYEKITNCKLKLSQAGRKGGLTSAQARLKQGFKHKIREDKIIVDKIKEDKIIPSESDFLNYCKEFLSNRYSGLEFSLKAKYEQWVADNWKDGNGNDIKNWKTKIKNTAPYLKPISDPKLTTMQSLGNAYLDGKNKLGLTNE